MTGGQKNFDFSNGVSISYGLSIHFSWGCGYRTLQTLCDWVSAQKKDPVVSPPPSIASFQRLLVRIEDKPPSFSCSREWIGSVEVALAMDAIFDVQCRLLHVRSGGELASDGEEGPFSRLEKHFRDLGSPVMMGGDADAASKALFGTLRRGSRKFLLIVDPHFWKGKGKSVSGLEDLTSSGYVSWKSVPSDFCDSSFYNLCFPLLKAASSSTTPAI